MALCAFPRVSTMSNVKVKLLIVDDDRSLRMSLSQLFTELGHSVRSAEDGSSALLEIREEVPDIILSDLNMPGMSGFELLSIVRRRFPAIHVIAMSGRCCGDDVLSGIAADAFFQKGTNLSSLLQTVHAMISAGTAAGFRAGSSDVPMTAFDEACVSTSRGFPRPQVR
jgi:CheY-like chemotaxis protein